MKKDIKLKITIGLMILLMTILLTTNVSQASEDIVVLLDPGHGVYRACVHFQWFENFV